VQEQGEVAQGSQERREGLRSCTSSARTRASSREARQATLHIHSGKLVVGQRQRAALVRAKGGGGGSGANGGAAAVALASVGHGRLANTRRRAAAASPVIALPPPDNPTDSCDFSVLL
jgi:hypothetical protein